MLFTPQALDRPPPSAYEVWLNNAVHYTTECIADQYIKDHNNLYLSVIFVRLYSFVFFCRLKSPATTV
uniref:Uncharacterized protein n=1 Tax=Anguilla anguilla TaxID=7936 RepID=A0A0E9W6D8_ANGAN